MFDIGFGELLLIAVVALVVLGPERLPKAARFAGLWVRRARAQWHSVRSELERELAADELKRSLDEARSAVDEAGREVRDAGQALRRDAGALESGVRSQVAGLRDKARLIAPEPPAEADADSPGVGAGRDSGAPGVDPGMAEDGDGPRR